MCDAGLLVVFYAPALSTQERQFLESTAGQLLFDISVAEAAAHDGFLRQALRRAEALRLETRANSEDKADHDE